MKRYIKEALYRSGSLRALRYRNRKLLRVLMYHHFRPETTNGLARQCEYLKKEYNVISLTEAAECFRAGAPLPDNAVVITVDDGYRDFFLYAYPVFREYEIPSIVYLVSDFLDGRSWPWWNRLMWALQSTSQERLALADGAAIELGATPAARTDAFRHVVEWLKDIPNAERTAFMARLPDVLQVHIPDDPPPPYAPMSWDEVRTMASDGVEFGAHTVTHPILSQVETDEELEAEICGSRDRIACELGVAPVHFSYPNGRVQDVGKRVRDVVAACGFQTGVSTTHGFNGTDLDPLLLNRIAMEPDADFSSFRVWLAGVGI
jgi:peptidoglycan/xylan/chitin deacetylase (PgdA/CDA1 family)